MIITRDILEALKKWKTSTDRKPILIKGARQIGKTWVMEEFGRQCYEHYVKFDFDEQRTGVSFSNNKGSTSYHQGIGVVL